MRTIVIIPAYNEERSIGKVIDDIRAHHGDVDIIVIDDGSDDATARVAVCQGVEVVSLPYNLGIGGAMQTGYRYAERKGYDLAVQFDGDGQHRADQLDALMVPVLNGDADITIGSRFLGERGYRSRLPRLVGIKILSVVVSLMCGRRVTDPTSGFRAVNRSVISFFSRLYPDDYPEAEAVVLLSRLGFRTVEVPVLMRERQAGVSSITAVRSLYYMLKVVLAILIDMLKRAPGR